MKKSDFKKIVHKIVEEYIENELQEDLNEIVKSKVKTYVPILVKEVCEDIITDSLNEIVSNAPSRGRTLSESVNEDDWPTLSPSDIHAASRHMPEERSINRDKVAAMLGYGSVGGGSGGNGPLVDTIVDDAGNPRRVDHVPPDLQKALTRDYSELVKAMDKKTKQTRGK